MEFLFTFSLFGSNGDGKKKSFLCIEKKAKKQSLKSGNHFYTHSGKSCDEFLARAFENHFLCLREEYGRGMGRKQKKWNLEATNAIIRKRKEICFSFRHVNENFLIPINFMKIAHKWIFFFPCDLRLKWVLKNDLWQFSRFNLKLAELFYLPFHLAFLCLLSSSQKVQKTFEIVR